MQRSTKFPYSTYLNKMINYHLQQPFRIKLLNHNAGCDRIGLTQNMQRAM